MDFKNIISVADIFSSVGILAIFAGTYVISRNLLLVGLRKEIAERIIKTPGTINFIYKIVAEWIFGLKGSDGGLLCLFDPTDKKRIKIEQDSIFEPIRGLIWIVLGTVLQILGIFLK